MDAKDLHSKFLDKLQNCLKTGSFVKLTLSKPEHKNKELKNIYARLVEIKGESMLSFTLRHATKDVTKNHPIAEALAIIGSWLDSDFLNGDLYTTEEDIFIQYNKKRQPRIFTKPPSHQASQPTEHNKQKKRFIEASKDNVYLREMGITGTDGQVLPTGQKKFRQINKYIEIIDAQLQQSSLPADAHIVDMGSGKGYLTFALYDYLKNNLGMAPTIVGIELRQNLVNFCNALASKAGFEKLHFIAQDIQEYRPERIDMLIALHACDTATDLAIAKGIQAQAQVIVVAPCCHKQIRKQMHCESDLQSILKHGILEERQAELITDGIRSLLMEAQGYKTKVFEFISTEHTSKNLMITGTKGKPNAEALAKVEAIKKEFGIEYHYLEQLL
ncbi:MAG: SAM-dependent methyltransferase [Saprospiraceae bacterium]|nr:SAM-dependent methyltransferase [Saprospiraceae bacterium]